MHEHRTLLLGPASVITVTIVLAAVGLGAATVFWRLPEFFVITITTTLLCCLSLAYFLRRGGSRLIFTAPGLAFAYLAAGTILVPFSWQLDFLDPWTELVGIERRTLLWAGVFLLAFLLGWWAGYRPAAQAEGVGVSFTRRQLIVQLLLADVVGVIALFALLESVGGFSLALDSLDARREFFAGYGPLMGLTFVPGLASLYYIAAPRGSRTRFSRVLVLAGVVQYLVSTFFLGQKSFALVLALMFYVALARHHTPSLKIVALVVLSVLVGSIWYQREIREERATGYRSEAIQTNSVTGFIRSTWGPFADNGLYGLQTLGAVIPDAPDLSFQIERLAAAPASSIPRGLWPNKPSGASVLFSEQLFPERWARGTGTPPSLFAEAVWEFGRWGAIPVIFLASLIIALIDGRISRIRHPLGWGLHGVFAVAVFHLIKAGSDSGFQVFAMFSLALVVVLATQRVAGRTRG